MTLETFLKTHQSDPLRSLGMPTFGAGNLRPKGANYDSPGQRPGSATPEHFPSPESATHRMTLKIFLKTHQSVLLCSLGMPTFGAGNLRPKGANYDSPGHRPGSATPNISQALKGRPTA